MTTFAELKKAPNNKNHQVTRKILLGIIILIVLINLNKIFSYNPSGYIMTKQAFWTGEMTHYSDPGFKLRLFGDINKIKKETSVKFTNDKDEDNITTSAIFIRYNDGGTGYWGGTARFQFPMTEDIFDVIRVFGSEREAIRQLFIPGIREICTSTAGLISTEESYTTKRSMIPEWCSDQARDGVFFVDVEYQTIIDETGREQTVPVYSMKEDKDGNILRKKPIFGQFGIQNSLFRVSDISYLGNIDEQIEQKMTFSTELQVVASTIQTLEQRLNEAEATGRRKVTEAEMEQKTIKERVVQEVEAYRRTQILNIRADSIKVANDLLAVRNETAAKITEAEGEAARRAKQLQGDQALDIRIKAYREIMKAWSDALSARSENAPRVATDWDPDYYFNLLNRIERQVRDDLKLNMTF